MVLQPGHQRVAVVQVEVQRATGGAQHFNQPEHGGKGAGDGFVDIRDEVRKAGVSGAE